MTTADQPASVPAAPDDPSPITLGGRATYAWAARKRPFVHPVRTPAGHILTRDAPADHPWHHGLWFTIKFVNEENFWEEYDAYGVLRHEGRPTVTAEGDVTTVAGRLRWIRPDRESVALVEERTWTHRPLGDDAYALDFATTLVAGDDVVYDRTPFTTWGGYGGLALRGAGDWRQTRLLLADGSERDRVLGDPSPWCALDGEVGEGAHPAGIAVLAHPTSVRSPHPWYASTQADTYGDDGWSNFLNAAFLWDAPLPVAGGEPLHFAYRVVVHDGIWDRDRVAAAYDDYAAGPAGHR
jgi:hypothetical protein